MREPDPWPRPIVICALEYERQAMVRAGIMRIADLNCVGPGPLRIKDWIDQHARSDLTIILAGLAGGLSPRLDRGRAFLIDRVLEHREIIARPSIHTAPGITSVSITSSSHVLHRATEKQALHGASGAQMVDLESVSFALSAKGAGCVWGIVRGISDQADSNLPPGVAHFVDADGHTRIWPVLKAIIRRPWIIPALWRLRADCDVAMAAVCQTLRVILPNESPSEVESGSQSYGDTIPHDMKPCVLIFGGTFDPPHAAHTTLPPLAARQLGCSRIIYVPAAINPLKTNHPPAPAHHRLAMLKIALSEMPNVEISHIELDRPGPSYTIDTLRALRNRLGADTPLRLLIGADQALEFHRWKDWRKIQRLATPAVMLRPPMTRQSFGNQLRDRFDVAEAEQWMRWIVDLPMIDIAASDVRQNLTAGGPVDSIPCGVLNYIRANRLYES